MASQWQIRANQRSAARSTGPRTPEGLEASKKNSTRHGLTGKGIVLPEEMAEEVNARYNEFRSQWRPFDSYDDWLCEVASIESVKADCGQRHLIALKTDQARRAQTRWQADRMTEAERIAEKLIKSPGRVVLELKGFLQGAQWLILRWEGLVNVVEATGKVEDAQRQTALDLLGV